MSWNYKLDVSAVWSTENEGPALSKARQEVVSAVEAFIEESHLEGEADIDSIIEEMRDAADADDMEWFNSCWNAFYDFADAYRIWVKVW